MKYLQPIARFLKSEQLMDYVMALFFMSISSLLILILLNKDRSFIPNSNTEYAQTSVMLLNLEETSGGTGVILRSNNVYSEILTNKHVCGVIEGGGVVKRNGFRRLINSIKKYPDHDLCLVKVMTNYGINTKVSTSSVKEHSEATVSGHPSLYPNVITKGHFSGRKMISLIVGFKKCKSFDRSMFCLLYGVEPVAQPFETILVTATISPGSSGSAVFNEDGEISAMVFAGNGSKLSYAFAVPGEYIVDFLMTENKIPYKSVNRKSYSDLIDRVFKFNKKHKKENYSLWTKE